jgi:hypothetical protein
MRVRTWAWVACLSVVGVPASAQSLFSSSGVGLPIDPLDGRARALGSIGIGLQDAAILPADPASAGRLLFPSGVIAVQPSWTDVTQSGSPDHHYSRGNRFPLLGMAYPIARGMMTVLMTSIFD